MTPPHLEITDLTVTFGGVRALNQLSLEHSDGGVLGLIGPNGAGKTTVLNVLSGAVPASGGAVRLDGKKLTGLRADKIARAGVARTFQNLQTFNSLTALENVLVPLEAKASATPFVGLVRPITQSRQLRAQARELLDRVGMTDDPDTPVTALSYGARRRVEVARALASRPRLLMLDEPLAGLSRAESDALASVIDDVAASGITVLLVEHDMAAVMRISDWVVVLHHGQLLAQGKPADIQADEQVRAAYLGDELEYDPRLHKGGDAAISTSSTTVDDTSRGHADDSSEPHVGETSSAQDGDTIEGAPEIQGSETS